jgi:ATP-dependent helicase HrpB
LKRLGALSHSGHITPHGKHMAELPLHPRLAHMLIKAAPLQLTRIACEIAALMSERDILRGPRGWRNADLRLRLDVLHGHRDHAAEATVDRGAYERVQRTTELWRRQLGRHPSASAEQREDVHAAGRLLALAYPDRIAQRQPGQDARYLLSNGRGALFPSPDPLGSEPYLVIADLDAGAQWARIDLAAPLSLADIEALYADEIGQVEAVNWDDKSQAVRAVRQRQLGALVLSEQALSKPDPSLICAALVQAVRQAGLATLAWTTELNQWRARVQFLRRIEGPDSTWPDVSDEALLKTAGQWLGPYLSGITTLERVKRLDLAPALHALLTWEQQRDMNRLAPTHITVPSGSHIRIDYDTSDLPILAVRLQEMFGCKETPRVVHGQVPLLLHLLSPAKRPVQVTKDLASFWKSAYQEVRKELRGRYPKHHWPDDPFTAPPTAKIKRRSG